MEVVACAVTFGTVIAQLGAVTIRFKNLWDEITGVPDRIAELLEDMDFFRLLFAQMETSIKDPNYPNLPLSFWTGPLMQISLNRAKQALAALERITRELDDELRKQKKGLKRTLVAIRGLMNKEKIQGLEMRFEKAVKLLQMSYDISSRHLQEERLRRHVTHSIRAEMAITITGLHSTGLLSRSITETEEPSEDYKRKLTPRNFAKDQTRAVFRWRLPSWWSTTVWEVCSAPQPGWNYGLRVYNMVPYDSPIIRSIRSKDAEAVTELFRSRRASPFDRTESDGSLLQVAVFIPSIASLSVIRALLEWSPSELITASSTVWKSPLGKVSLRNIRMPIPCPENHEILQLFWPRNHDVDGFWDFYDPSTPILDHRPPTYYDTSIKWKCAKIREELIWAASDPPVDSLWISADGIVQPSHITLSIAHGNSLIHSAAIRLFLKAVYTLSVIRGWRIDDKFTQDIAKASTPESLHQLEANMTPMDFDGPTVNFGEVTPLMFLIGSIASTLGVQTFFNTKHGKPASLSSPVALQHFMQMAVYNWVHNLRCAGVNLTTYGHKERSLLHGNDGLLRGLFDADSDAMAMWNTWWPCRPWSITPPLPIWLVDLTYGAEPNEWDLIFVIEFEAMARDFWDMIDKQAFTGMPGTWVE